MKRKNAKRKGGNMAKSVLIADDSPTIRKIVELCLVGQGIEVHGAASGNEAMAALKAGSFDLVLADAVMPAPDGYALCEAIKEGTFGAAPPVILLADVLQPLDASRLAACGADGQIAKPFEAATLQLMACDQLGLEPPATALRSIPEMRPYSSARSAAASDSFAPNGGTQITAASIGALNDADMEALAKRIVQMLSDQVVRDVAWEVVPEMSELLIKERMQARS